MIVPVGTSYEGSEEEARKKAEAEGLNWDSLTDEQKDSIYRDIAGERDVANREYADANDRYNEEGPEGRNSGRVYSAANPLEHLASALRRRQGKADQATAKGELAKISKADQEGRRVAGGLAAGRDRELMNLYKDFIKNRDAKKEVSTMPKASSANNPSNPANFRRPQTPMLSAQNPPQTPKLPSGFSVPSDKEGWNNYLSSSMLIPDPRSAQAAALRDDEEELGSGYFGFMR